MIVELIPRVFPRKKQVFISPVSISVNDGDIFIVDSSGKSYCAYIAEWNVSILPGSSFECGEGLVSAE